MSLPPCSSRVYGAPSPMLTAFSVLGHGLNPWGWGRGREGGKEEGGKTEIFSRWYPWLYASPPPSAATYNSLQYEDHCIV